MQQATSEKTTRNQANVPADFEQVDSPSQFAGGKAEKMPGDADGSSATQQQQSAAAQDDATTTDDASAGKRSLGQKIKDGMKGEAKVLSGHIKRDSEKVQAGKAIRKGEA